VLFRFVFAVGQALAGLPGSCTPGGMWHQEMSYGGVASGSSGGAVEPDVTVQSFARWLSELKVRNSKALQEMLSETSIIRDSISTNNMELTDFKRHSSGISQQMQSQLTDLREKLTSAFGEITALVKQKTQSDAEMMQDVNMLQQNLSQKTSELEALKKSYSQAHSQLQSSLIQIQNHLQVTQGEVQLARKSCDRVWRDSTQRFTDIEHGVHSLMDELNSGTSESKGQMVQLREEIARIQESLSSVGAEFLDHQRMSNTTHNKLQSQVWGLEEGRTSPTPSMSQKQGPAAVHTMAGSISASQASLMSCAGRTGSVTLPQNWNPVTSPRRSPSLPQPMTMPGAMHGMIPTIATRSSHMVPAMGSAPSLQYMSHEYGTLR